MMDIPSNSENSPNNSTNGHGNRERPVIELGPEEARAHFFKNSSYFDADLPPYLSFEPLLASVADALGNRSYKNVKSCFPDALGDVNYHLIANKDGRFAWRPYELIHPVLYVSLVNVLCAEENWRLLQQRFRQFSDGIVRCCSIPVVSTDEQTDVAAQVRSWWQLVEQESLKQSLRFRHVLHTDVVNCYGTLYTHSIPWALHGKVEAKAAKHDKNLLGNILDAYIRAGRYGQTNGIPQGSPLMHLIAELVLGYVDKVISANWGGDDDVQILRYRDDYRIFANTAEQAEQVLRTVADALRSVGMRLGVAKTLSFDNVVEGSIKPDKLAGIGLQDLGTTNAKTIQKQLLRLHAFGQKYTNSGALRRLVSDFYDVVRKQRQAPDDLAVQVAIATDIGYVSPGTFPAIAAILSHLISLEPDRNEAAGLWMAVREKMRRVPHNGYLEVWLQRVIQPLKELPPFEGDEPLCQIVSGKNVQLWNNEWISCQEVLSALNVRNLVVKDPSTVSPDVEPDEVKLFRDAANRY